MPRCEIHTVVYGLLTSIYIFISKQAAGVLAKLDYRISSGEEARKLDGIGDKISKKIDEFLQTGKLDKLEKVCNDQ